MTNKRRKAKKKVFKMSIRLLPAANERLRSHLRGRGDESDCVMAALAAFEISDIGRQIPRVSMSEAVPPTTVMLSPKARLRLERLASKTGASMNAIINGALMEWEPGK